MGEEWDVIQRSKVRGSSVGQCCFNGYFLKEQILITVLVKDILDFLGFRHLSQSPLFLAFLIGQLPRLSLLVLDFLQPVELLPFQFIQLTDDVLNGPIYPWYNDYPGSDIDISIRIEYLIR